ncbi:MAG: radical SAM protein [Desulfobaccales bacterium]
MVKATANSNFYFLGGEPSHESQDSEYQEYRRCWRENPANFIVRDFPLHLDVEISSRCNLRCTFCDKLPLLAKDQLGDMDYPLYQKILDECHGGRLWGLKLSYRGEPLLHPRVVEMVAYAKARGVLDVYFNTNGMLLTPEMSRGLMDAGLDRISVSVEGTDPVAFERERRGAKFHRILENLDQLISLRTQKGCTKPRVRVQTVKFPGLDLEEYSRFWSAHADEVAAIDYKDSTHRVKDLVNPHWACPQLWQRLTIEWTGAVMPCNNDDYRLLCMGNARDRSIASCWHDPLVEQARTLHRRGLSQQVEACNGCPWRTAQIHNPSLQSSGEKA